jgi:hypothetical protein
MRKFDVKKLVSFNGKIPASAVVMVTPEMAKFWKKAYHFKGQRKLRRDHVEYIKAEIEAGEMDVSAMHFAANQSGVYQVDGMHRIEAIIETGIAIYVAIIVHPARAADVYSKMDIGGSRSPADMYAAKELGKELGISRKDLSCTHRAARMVFEGWKGRKKLPSRITEVFIREFAEEFKLFSDHTKGGLQPRSKRMRRGDISGIALITYRYNPAAAEEFWKGVSHDDMLPKGDPRKALGNWIDRAPTTGGRYFATGCTQVPAWGAASICAQAWKKFLDGEKWDFVPEQKFTGSPHIAVAGTPYDSLLDGNGMFDVDGEVSMSIAAG